jgi:hypothetical protein
MSLKPELAVSAYNCGFTNPTFPPSFWLIRAIRAAHRGATALVPPIGIGCPSTWMLTAGRISVTRHVRNPPSAETSRTEGNRNSGVGLICGDCESPADATAAGPEAAVRSGARVELGLVLIPDRLAFYRNPPVGAACTGASGRR